VVACVVASRWRLSGLPHCAPYDHHAHLPTSHPHLPCVWPAPTRAATIDSITTATMAGQISSALSYLERQRVIHRDIAARNVLVGNGPVKRAVM